MCGFPHLFSESFVPSVSSFLISRSFVWTIRQTGFDSVAELILDLNVSISTYILA